MKKVTIPTWCSPYIVMLNGVRYIYNAGVETDVPDEVAKIIEADIAVHENGNVQVGTGGGGSMLVVKLEYNEAGEVSSNTSYDELLSAIKNGIPIFATLKYFDVETEEFNFETSTNVQTNTTSEDVYIYFSRIGKTIDYYAGNNDASVH